jgi:hypothetical protein
VKFELIPTSEVATRLGLARSGVSKAMHRIGITSTGAQGGRSGEDLWAWEDIERRWNDPRYRPGRGRVRQEPT